MTRKRNMRIRSALRSGSFGTYVWDLKQDAMFGDDTIAEIFGLEPEKAKFGLPSSNYLASIHPDDRSRIIASMEVAIETEDPFFEEYRVVPDAGVSINVIAMGQCFHSEAGAPLKYAGMIFRKDPADARAGLLERCLEARDMAASNCNPMVSYLLAMAVLELSSTHASGR